MLGIPSDSVDQMCHSTIGAFIKHDNVGSMVGTVIMSMNWCMICRCFRPTLAKYEATVSEPVVDLLFNQA